MDATSAQTVTINNNNKTSTSTCTASFVALPSYNIKYNFSGAASLSTDSAPTSVKVGELFKVGAPTRPGYKFAGWLITGMDSTTHYYGININYQITTTEETLVTDADYYKNLRSSSGTVTFRATWSLDDRIKELAKTDTTNLAYDGTGDNNLRYIGVNPPNYVKFNNELWRIIGVMNNVKDSNGISASRVKIIRNDSLISLSWDSTNENNWSTSSLQKLLNSGNYWNRTDVYSDTGLTSEAKNIIASVVWNLGGFDSTSYPASSFYNVEKGTRVSIGNPKTWTGYVGLIYPSDYGYAVGNDGGTRNYCLNTDLSEYDNETSWVDDEERTTRCNQYNWLVNEKWTLTPNHIYRNQAFYIHSFGDLNISETRDSRNVYPVVFLNTNVKIIGGSGTSSDPYILVH